MGKVLFSEESRFSIQGADGRGLVWRPQEERSTPVYMEERVIVMVWRGVSC